MRRHVVVALHGVDEQRVAVRHQAREEPLEIPPHVGVGVLWIRSDADVCCRCSVHSPVCTPVCWTRD